MLVQDNPSHCMLDTLKTSCVFKQSSIQTRVKLTLTVILTLTDTVTLTSQTKPTEHNRNVFCCISCFQCRYPMSVLVNSYW